MSHSSEANPHGTLIDPTARPIPLPLARALGPGRASGARGTFVLDVQRTSLAEGPHVWDWRSTRTEMAIIGGRAGGAPPNQAAKLPFEVE
jgi:hypothetical protein